MATNGIYTLNNTTISEDAEEKRLNFQHNMFFRMTGYEQMPKHIKDSLPENPRIADIATGTAIWPRQLAKALSNARLDGFDMTDLNYPRAELVPPNLTLHKFSQNILEPFPAEFQGQFDVVHIRFLVFALKAGQWDRAVASAATLLKPGGWMFWEESSYYTFTSIPPSQAMHDILSLDMKWSKGIGRDIAQPVTLQNNLKNAGLTDVGYEYHRGYEIEGGHWKELTEACYNLMTQTLYGIVRFGGTDGLRTKEDADRLSKALRKDIDEVPDQQITADIKWVWGQKPQ